MNNKHPLNMDFVDYFDLADELSSDSPDALTIDDFDKRFVDAAKKASTALGLPWPPDMTYAEEYALDHRGILG